ncbi:unnamed protein product [Rhizoctonia solani]|uniref:PNPLA domain-containing protein n=1 Tax=Rhizoctonia solani TaxID=456999 RepID=A0A8H3A2G1_9AGAM|nr:unnamed protein product [Rhizoctonia solani]
MDSPMFKSLKGSPPQLESYMLADTVENYPPPLYEPGPMTPPQAKNTLQMDNALYSIPLRILCIDGGGARGLSSLLVLKEFLHRTKNSGGSTNPKKGEILPYEHFDMICGTGTGGLSAVMLGRLRMPIDEAIQAHVKLMKAAFSTKLWFRHEGRHSARKVENVISELIGREDRTVQKHGSTQAGDLGRRIESRGYSRGANKCKVLLLGCASNETELLKLDDYRTQGLDEDQLGDTIAWEALRTITAALPSKLHNRTIYGKTKYRHTDPEPANSNPIRRFILEALRDFPGRPIGHIISLGTGQKEVIQLPKALWIPKLQLLDRVHLLRQIATECENTHQDTHQAFRSDPNVYFRFNVDRGVEGVELEEWKNVQAICHHTRAYMQRGEIDAFLDQAVLSFIACRASQ